MVFSKSKKIIGSIVIVVLLIAVYAFNLFSFLEYKFEDWLYQRPTAADPMIAVIGIDEQTQAELGPFQQWSRQILADAIRTLNSDPESRPAVIAIDVLFAGESNDEAADMSLAQAAADGGNVVTVSQALIGDDVAHLSTGRFVTGIETPYPALAAAADYGLANPIVDGDNLIRDAMLSTVFDGAVVSSFPNVIVQKYTGGDTGFGDESYITYSGEPGEFFQLSFADLFAEDFDPTFFADCIVMIGPYATAMMDAYYTPISSQTQMYGVEIHANVVQMLLEGNFKHRVPFAIGLCILLLLCAVATVLRIPDIRAKLGVTVLLCAGYLGLALYLFRLGTILPLLYPVFSLVVLYLYELIYGYIVETMEKQRVKNVFKKYVDPKLVDQLVAAGEAHSDEVGLKKNIAVLFVDIRGFTPMSEALRDEPEMVVRILNEYLELTSGAVFNHGGSVDKFVGDATMALFNGFVPLHDYVFQAVCAAFDMVRGAAEVNASIHEKYGVDVGFGIGVHCGEAIVGNLGPSFRKDYTAIGDTVNTAARLEANAKRSQVLISRVVYDLVKDRVTAESVGEIPLKGKSIPLEVFSVTGIL